MVKEDVNLSSTLEVVQQTKTPVFNSPFGPINFNDSKSLDMSH
jgi:hypothetical protein